MISTRQCKAARSLLDWTLEDLSKICGLSKTSLNNFEMGGNATAKTHNIIVKAFEDAGIEFTPEPGVRLRGQPLNVVRWQGDNVMELLLDDVFVSCVKEGRETLSSGLDEKAFEGASHDKDLIRRQIRRKRQYNSKERVILKEGDQHLIFPPDVTTYRWISPELFGLVPTITYGNKHAIVVYGPPLGIVVTENSQVADMYRQQFELLWSLAKPLPLTDEEIAAICHKNLPLDENN